MGSVRELMNELLAWNASHSMTYDARTNHLRLQRELHSQENAWSLFGFLSLNPFIKFCRILGYLCVEEDFMFPVDMHSRALVPLV